MEEETIWRDILSSFPHQLHILCETDNITRFHVWTNLKTPFKKMSYFSYGIATPSFCLHKTHLNLVTLNKTAVKKDHFKQ